jgi:hypothetical protein
MSPYARGRIVDPGMRLAPADDARIASGATIARQRDVPTVGAGIDDPDVTDVADHVRLLVGLALSAPYSGMHFLRN